jgi:hypothetical protein
MGWAFVDKEHASPYSNAAYTCTWHCWPRWDIQRRHTRWIAQDGTPFGLPPLFTDFGVV